MLVGMLVGVLITAYVETMYILDLSIDQRCADLPVKPVPWSRYTSVLKELNVEES